MIIRISPMILSDHSTESESTNMAAIISIEPGSMAVNHDGYRVLDEPPQELQVASNPGLSIALRSGEIPGFSQWGQ